MIYYRDHEGLLRPILSQISHSKRLCRASWQTFIRGTLSCHSRLWLH